MYTATYSPEDNKLRLYSISRLDKETYERVRAAGFIWAPKQELFVAPAWTPSREDLLLELCGEIGDEDTSLVDRAEERAERFSDYSENRAEDAEQAREAVSKIADNIPLGQPILVGHHSERHARKDAERIENGMRRAVKMWETSQYWKQRAAGAIRAAKYKELPNVRARRIKGIEADKRKREREKSDCETCLKFWQHEGITPEQAKTFANYADHYGVTLPIGEPHWSLWSALEDGKITVEQARAERLASIPGMIAYRERWLAHFENRLVYERTMLAESGGMASDKVGPEEGGACRCWASPRGGWSYIQKVNKVSVTVLDNWGNGGANFTRTMPFDKLSGVMSKAQVDEAKAAGMAVESSDKTGFFLLTEKPKSVTTKPQEETPFDVMCEQLKEGVKVVSAPQLFPTPPALAARMVDAADLEPGQTVLEPSAGTGNILRAIRAKIGSDSTVRITAVEICEKLTDLPLLAMRVHYGDFLACNGNLGQFDRILMNPPFERGQDIQHIKHALTMLKPGGHLVAICANGPRQNEVLRPIAEESGGYWQDLPADTFKDQGTGVRTALVVIGKNQPLTGTIGQL